MCSYQHYSALSPSLAPRPEEEEEKGPGFSHSRMCLIISDLSTCLSVGGMLMMPSESHGYTCLSVGGMLMMPSESHGYTCLSVGGMLMMPSESHG